MDNEIKVWLYDILNAIYEIDSFSMVYQKNLHYIKMICALKEQWKEILKL